MPQLSYSIGPIAGTPGMRYGNTRSNETCVTAICGAIIAPGTWCEFSLVNGQYVAMPLQDTGTTTTFLPKLCGVAVLDTVGAEQAYQTFQVPNSGLGSTFPGYPVGLAVSFMRRGAIWVAWDGNTGTALPYPVGTMNVWHSSTGAAAQGVVTTLAASATAGSEIDALGAYATFYDPRQVSGTFTDPWGVTRSAVVMDINLPGHS